MITGSDIRRARERGKLSQQELAARVDVSLRTIGNWERGETIPRNREAALRDALGPWLSTEGSQSPAGLQTASDAELLAEIARRFERGKAGGEHEHRSAPMKNGPAYGIEGPEPPLRLAADDPGTESEGSARRRRQDEDAES